MNVIYYGGRQAGVVGLLAVLASKHEVVCVIPVDEPVELVARALGLNVQKPKNINDASFFVHSLEPLKADMFFSCHGRQIIKSHILGKYRAVNVHPCLYGYKGAEPIKRLLEEGNTKASVAVHWMTEKVDEGEVILENFQEVAGTTEAEVYNELYPLYAKTIIEALRAIEASLQKERL